MSDRSEKSVYVATFCHTKRDDEESIITVIAISFDEAIKKANENIALVQTSKDDVVEMTGIALYCNIDVE